MKWKPSQSVIENANNVLPKLVEKYFKAGHKAADGKRSPKELHEFRIETKEFRYTLELFCPVYGTRLENELEPLRDLQSVLGKLHDYYIIAEILEDDQGLGLQAKLQRRTKKKLKEFHEQWAEFDSKGELKRWKTLLAAPPKKSAASAHSKPRARKGSTEAARRAGMKLASGPTKTTPNTTAA
jgi:CHAD domain-containing protein